MLNLNVLLNSLGEIKKLKKWITPLLLFCCLSIVIVGTASASTTNNDSNPDSTNSGINVTDSGNQTINDNTDPSINVTNNTSVLTVNAADPSGNVTLTELSGVAGTVKNYYESNNNLPSNVTINGQTITMSQLLQLLVTGTVNINNNNLNSLPIQAVNTAPSPSGNYSNGSLQELEYLTLASSIKNFITNNGRAPNYASTTLGNIQFNTLVYMYSKILNFYGLQNGLPLTITTSTIPEGPLTVTGIQPISNSISVVNVAVHVIFNSQMQLSNGFNNIYILNTANNTHVPMITSITGSVLTLIPLSNWAPGTTYTVMIPANALTNENGYGLTSDYTSSFTTAFNNSATLTQLSTEAAYVKNYYETHNSNLPTNVTINGQAITMPEFLMLLATGVSDINYGKLNSVPVLMVNPAHNPIGNFTQGNLSLSEYLSANLNVQIFIRINGRAPNYASTSLGDIPFNELVYMYSKIMNFYGINDRLPSYVGIN